MKEVNLIHRLSAPLNFSSSSAAQNYTQIWNTELEAQARSQELCVCVCVWRGGGGGVRVISGTRTK